MPDSAQSRGSSVRRVPHPFAMRHDDPASFPLPDDHEVLRLICAPGTGEPQDTRERQIAGMAHDIGYQEGRRVDGETVICCDHMKIATPGCEHHGCGLVTLGKLIDTYSNPS